MTLSELKKGMAVIKAAYPEFYKDINDEDLRVAVNLWHEMLKEYSYEVFGKAIRQHICESKFAPKISEIIEQIERINPKSRHGLPNREDVERMKRLIGKMNALPEPEQQALLTGRAQLALPAKLN